MKKVRAEIVLKGVVQGVGFRPFVHRLAQEHKLTGFVRNSSDGVTVFAEGERESIDLFFESISKEAPPLAIIQDRSLKLCKPEGSKEFRIKESKGGKDKSAVPPPDVSICDSCLKELFDHNDRRYRYPFINCTSCGPRFTIIKNLPFDRAYTTMNEFKMCSECNKEYNEITDRRYHIQTNACEKCGPEVSFIKDEETIGQGESAIKLASECLKNGEIVVVKGAGGFHFMSDAENENMAERIRTFKGRKFKPIAVMSYSLSDIKKYAWVSEEEERLLTSPERPIVLLRKKEPFLLANSIAPFNQYIGVMLPYLPIHYLLLHDSGLLAIVDTSGNLKGEPLIYRNDEALKKLSSMTRYFLIHNRDIHIRCDDSVVKMVSGLPMSFRRARGYVPLPIKLSKTTEPILATGGEIKNTFCITRKNLAFLSQHIGDIKNLDVYEFYKETIEHFKYIFKTEPEIIAYDLHPEYLSTNFVKELTTWNSHLTTIGIQHHHAHIASCMAENGVEGEVIGIAFDGTGYGTDGNVWGGEFFVGGYNGFKRTHHLKYIPLPGGDQAAHQPWRMAVSYLAQAFGEEALRFTKRWSRSDFIYSMIKKGINCPLASSMGRLFDAVSSLLGFCDINTYEGEAAVRLENQCHNAKAVPYNYKIDGSEIDVSPMIREIMLKGEGVDKIAQRFHLTIVDIILEVCKELRKEYGIGRVVLSGGVFQNKIIIEKATELLRRSKFNVFTHLRVPPNDGGLSLGQVAIAQYRIDN
ncbi:carbamoyltransferase HypF [candidate division WOR-3 bacterium]|nr:carbamoyltransferase HypF [candidate division WOR-3 bacterium]